MDDFFWFSIYYLVINMNLSGGVKNAIAIPSYFQWFLFNVCGEELLAI
ncbi:hypothetical protein AD41_2107 [Escherichia coli 3-020-07_S4_C3]|nr:hypothetical protein AD41_2107 [Escherichia coli 3-020-07_S4_C3]